MGKFQDQLIEQGGGAIGSVVGAGLGLMLGGINDRRQLKQQGRLNEQQWKFDQRAIDYNYEKQLEMWERTGFGGQMEQLKKAGLNPGLLYGMGGAGGATVGSGGGGGVHGTSAPAGGGEIMGMMQQKMQMSLLEAQKEVLLSQANKNNVEANKTAGVDTEEAKTRIASLTQGIENQKAIEQLTKAETYLKALEGVFQGESMEDRLDQVYWNTEQAMNQVELARQQVYINSKTLQDKIKIIQQEAIGAGLRNLLTSAQTDKTRSDIGVNQAQINKWAIELVQSGYALEQKDRELKIREFAEELKEQYPGVFNVIGKTMNEFIENIMKLTPQNNRYKGQGVK